MRIIVRPIVDPQREIDMTNCLVAAIAEELWRLYGGNERLNWIEAERHLGQIVGRARLEAVDTEVVERVEHASARHPPELTDGSSVVLKLAPGCGGVRSVEERRVTAPVRRRAVAC